MKHRHQSRSGIHYLTLLSIVWWTVTWAPACLTTGGAKPEPPPDEAMSEEMDVGPLAEADSEEWILKDKGWGVNPEAFAIEQELRERGDCPLAVLNSLALPLQSLCEIPEGEETDEDLFPLADLLASSGLTSRVEFTTPTPGAVIRYRLITSAESETAGQLSNESVETIRIGHYYVWAERQGQVRSDPHRRCRIVQKDKRIELEELP